MSRATLLTLLVIVGGFLMAFWALYGSLIWRAVR